MSSSRTVLFGVGIAAALAGALACSSKSSPAPSPSPVPTTGCTPSTSANTLVIMNNAICPQALTVPRGSQVTIVNQDSRSHNMTSDPHPEHTDCPELNQIGFLNAGQQRASGNLNTARRCGLHDHNDSSNNALKATITVQ
jgi:plastocyanin